MEKALKAVERKAGLLRATIDLKDSIVDFEVNKINRAKNIIKFTKLRILFQ